MTISYEQPMRESLKATMDAVNELPESLEEVKDAISAEEARATQVETSLQSNITAEYQRANQAENNLTTLYGQLSSTVTSMSKIVNTIPDFEYGYSDAVTIPASGSASVEITFNKTFAETPQVFTEIMCNTSVNILTGHVTYVDTAKCTIKLYNGGSTDAQNVTVDYLALAGR